MRRVSVILRPGFSTMLTVLGLALTLTAAMLASLACGGQPPASPAADARSAVERGAYLVSIGGCNDCHTPLKMGPNGPEPDTSRLLSGHPESFPPVAEAQLSGAWLWAGTGTMTAFSGPWGISFAANLTPDEETGLGVFTEQTFITAMRSGKHMGAGRPLLPPMPWQSCAHMTDEDLKAVFAYLQSIPPIHNKVPDPVPPPAAHTAAG